MQRYRLPRTRFTTLFLIVLPMFGLLLGSPSINNNVAYAKDDLPKKQVVGMDMACDEMSKEAVKSAQKEYGLCLSKNKDSIEGQSYNGIRPLNVVSGNCGTTSIYIYPTSSGGVARIVEGANSIVGPMANLAYTVRWTNLSSGRQASYDGGAWPWSSSWSNTDNVFTGGGTVNVRMTYFRMTTATGYICYGFQPYDTTVLP